MTRMLDCLVSYFGLDENDRPLPRRFYCYHVFAGPGPTAGAGVAAVTTLALHDETQRCTSCKNFHTVMTGGPAAALAAAVRYLDVYHEHNHLRKVQSDIRGLQRDQGDAIPSHETLFPVSRGRSLPTRKG